MTQTYTFGDRESCRIAREVNLASLRRMLSQSDATIDDGTVRHFRVRLPPSVIKAMGGAWTGRVNTVWQRNKP